MCSAGGLHLCDTSLWSCECQSTRKPPCPSMKSTRAQCILQRVFSHSVNRQHCLHSSSSTPLNFILSGKGDILISFPDPSNVSWLVNSFLVQRICKRSNEREAIHSNEIHLFYKKIHFCFLWGQGCTIFAQILSFLCLRVHSSLFHFSHLIKPLWKVTVVEGNNFASSSSHPQLGQLY